MVGELVYCSFSGLSDLGNPELRTTSFVTHHTIYSILVFCYACSHIIVICIDYSQDEYNLVVTLY